MIGRRLAHYEILEKLGQGGMGEVYRAHDDKLGRDVALKVLPEDAARDPERRARFLREARSVAALKHPNIVTIHSVEEVDGIPFITMELVEGHSLSFMIPPDGLRLDHFFNYAVPLADAIAFAHDRGITHRDLKPANVMIDHDHRVKVLDFGLAKLFAPDTILESAETLMRTSDTAAGRILGTPAYMSPEQAEGKSIDHRSDIFSLGIVLYEMTTGTRPFQGDTPISTISSILKDQPRSVTDLKPANPRELARIISHCLEKDPERRFQSAKDVRNQMDGLRRELDSGEIVPSLASQPSMAVPVAKEARSGGMKFSRVAAIAGMAIGLVVAVMAITSRDRPSGPPPISPPSTPGSVGGTAERQMAVVFPFQNLGPADDEYFAAGISEEITSRLASVSGLGVISRTSAGNYDRSGKTTKQIGADLGVDYVLDGSVRWAKSGDGKGRVRITPQLVRVSDDTPVWTETYDREMSDIFDVQIDIATHVVDALGVTLQAPERAQLAEPPTSNVEAYQKYLRAKTLVCSFLGDCDKELVGLLEEAIALDPNFLAAWCDLVRHHAFFYHTNTDRTEARIARAKSALDRMEAIDPLHPWTRLARGFYLYHGYRDYDRALAEFKAVEQARPNDPEAIFAQALIYRRKGELAGVPDMMKQIIELDPKNAQYHWELADTYDAMRQPELAQKHFDLALAIDNDLSVYGEKVMSSLRHRGDVKLAQHMLDTAPDPQALDLLFARMIVYFSARDYDGAIKLLRSTEVPVPAIQAGLKLYAGITKAFLRNTEDGRADLEEGTRRTEAVLHDAPGDYRARSGLALGYALLGRNEDAIREAKLAAEVISKDAYAGPMALEGLAYVYARTGHADEAVDLIERLLAMHYDDPLTVASLRLDPVWDPLRENPKFKELLKRSS